MARRTKKDSTVKVGNILNLEGGVGRDLLQGGLTVGVAYYATYKLTSDTLNPLGAVLINGKNRIYGVGPEGSGQRRVWRGCDPVM